MGIMYASRFTSLYIWQECSSTIYNMQAARWKPNGNQMEALASYILIQQMRFCYLLYWWTVAYSHVFTHKTDRFLHISRQQIQWSVASMIQLALLNRDPKFWLKVWCDAGCSSGGVLFQLRKHAKQCYKYKVRRLQRTQDYLRHERTYGWSTTEGSHMWLFVWSSYVLWQKRSATSAPVVDGISCDTSIANFWCSKFEQFLNTSHTHTHDADLLLDELDHLITSDNVHEVMIVPGLPREQRGPREKLSRGQTY